MSTPEAEPLSPRLRLHQLLCSIHQEWFGDIEGDHLAEISLGETTKAHPQDRRNEAWGRIVYTANDSGAITYCPPYQEPGVINSYRFTFSPGTTRVTEVKEWLNTVGSTERLEAAIPCLGVRCDVLSEITGFVEWALDDYDVSVSMMSGDEVIDSSEPSNLPPVAGQRPAKYLLRFMQPGTMFKFMKRF